MAEKDTQKAGGDDTKAGAEVTEEQLLKSLQKLEGKAEDETEEEEKEASITAAKLTKSTGDTVQELASEDLQKALEISETLGEFAGLVGLHVDGALEALEKSLQGAAERDLAIAGVLEKMATTIEELTKKVEEYGAQPTQAKSKTSATKTDVLNKSADDGKKPTEEMSQEELVKSAQSRKRQIMAGLETLAKTAQEKEDETTAQEFTKALIKFESTGEISDYHAARAIKQVEHMTQVAQGNA